MKIINKKHITSLVTFIMMSSSPVNAQESTTLDCLVKPEMYIDISSPVDGILDSVLVKKAEFIKKKQDLVKLESSVEAARVEVARQEALMDKKIQTKIIKRSYAKRKLNRISELYIEYASSEQEQDEAETEWALAKTELAQVRLDKKKNELKLLLAKAELEQKTIKSPIDGIVIEQYLMPGESVNSGPILQLAKINPLLVEVVASAELFGLIKTGMSVKIKPDIPANSTFQATVNIVDRIIDAASGSFNVLLKLPNPDDKLVGGSKCIAIFPIKTPQTYAPFTNASSAGDGLPEDINTLLEK